MAKIKYIRAIWKYKGQKYIFDQMNRDKKK